MANDERTRGQGRRESADEKQGLPAKGREPARRGGTGAPEGAEIERGTDENGPRNELDVDGAFGADTPLGGERRDEVR